MDNISFGIRALNSLPENIKVPDNMPLIITYDAYLHPELMQNIISSYIERRKNINAKISEQTSESI